MSEMISFGAGVNSVAMTIMLVEQGWRGPVVFADTGGEHPETYCYLEYFERQYLKPLEMEITRISPATNANLYHDKRIREGIPSLEQFCLVRGIIPLRVTKWCSVEWKLRPLTAWREEHGIDRALVGIAADESARRVHYGEATVSYPLVDEWITRAECGRIIERKGLDLPVKSGCFFCPNQRMSQWRGLSIKHPDLYDRAIAMEDRAAENEQNWITLSDSDIPLRQMRERRWQGMVEMDLGDFMPCACRL